MEDYKAQYEAIKAENASLNGALEQFTANKMALESTMQELMSANINIKASAMLLEKKVTDLQTELATLKSAVTGTEVAVDLTDAA